MPKLIHGLKELFLETANQMMLNEGINAITIREIAHRSHVAVGTVYNYFPSKEALIAHAILADWQNVTAQMTESILSDSSAENGLQAIYQGIHDFASRYRPTWDECRTPSIMASVNSRHSQLIAQLKELTALALKQGKRTATDLALTIIAQELLSFSLTDEQPEELIPLLLSLSAPV